MEADRAVAGRGPQPRVPRSVLLAQRPHPPAGLVGVAQRRAVLVREDRRAHRLEQRRQAMHAVRQRARRDRQTLVGQPCADPVQGAQARVALEQEARPDARPVRRAGEQPGHGGRRHLGGRRRAPACPPPAWPADHPAVRTDLDFDQGRLLGAVGRVRAPATPAHPRIGGRVVLPGAFLKPRTLRAAVARRTGLPAPPPPRTRPLLPLARAAGIPLGQRRTRRAKLRQPGFQALDPPPRHPHPLAEPGLLPRQRSDHRLLAPRPAQGLAQLRVRLDAGLVKVLHLGLAGLQRLLQRPTLLAQPRHLHPQRHHRAALPRVHPGLPKQTVQTPHLALQRQGVPRRPAGLPRCRDHPPQLPPRRLPPPLPRSRFTPRPHPSPPQLLGARRLHPLTLPLVQRPPVPHLRRPGTRHRPWLLRPPGQRHARASVCVPYRHALDDTTSRSCYQTQTIRQTRRSPRLNRTFTFRRGHDLTGGSP